MQCFAYVQTSFLFFFLPSSTPTQNGNKAQINGIGLLMSVRNGRRGGTTNCSALKRTFEGTEKHFFFVRS